MPGKLARMASIWRIDGVFWTCALKERGQVLITRVGLLVDLYSVPRMTAAEAVETSVTITNSLSQGYTNLDDHTSQTSKIFIIRGFT